MDLNTGAIAVVAGCIVLWGALSATLERRNVTAPIAFLLLGLAVANPPLSLIHVNLKSSTIRDLAELTLALVLFADASRVNVRALRSDIGPPLRLLGIGLPLTIAAGGLVAAGLLGAGSLWVAAALAAAVAPTDAALGSSIMQDTRVPSGVRRLLNVESGLNDGIATPFVNLFVAGAVSEEVLHSPGVAHAAVSLLIGAGVGVGAGLLGGWCLRLAETRQLSAPAFRPIAVLALALCAYSATIEAGGNGFVAAFLAGMAYGSLTPRREDTIGFTENAGELLSLAVWFTFGAVMLVPGFRDARWQDVVFAVAALTVVRMGPVFLAMIGSGMDRVTVAFIGWFGPRGLASVVFGLVIVDSLDPAEAARVLAAVTVTVSMSVVAHGLTAAPLSARYGNYASKLRKGGPEHTDAPALPTRSMTGQRHRFPRTAP